MRWSPRSWILCAEQGLLERCGLVRKDGARSLGEESLLFGRKLDSSADPTADISGGDLGDAHRVTPKCDGNAAESLLSRTRYVKRNVKCWRGGQMMLRWVAAGVLEAVKGFRRLKGCA